MAKITNKQIQTIRTIQRKLAIPDDDYRASLQSHFPAKKWADKQRPSTKDLTAHEAGIVIDHLKRVSGHGVAHPGRPKKTDRSAQMKKIEALLTAGKKEWSYAETMARHICKVDRLEWVPDRDLYKIITALIKQGQRHGWPIDEL